MLSDTQLDDSGLVIDSTPFPPSPPPPGAATMAYHLALMANRLLPLSSPPSPSTSMYLPYSLPVHATQYHATKHPSGSVFPSPLRMMSVEATATMSESTTKR
jgi:hypothetical protein